MLTAFLLCSILSSNKQPTTITKTTVDQTFVDLCVMKSKTIYD